MLSFPGIPFQGVFGIRVSLWLALRIIDYAFMQDFPYFSVGNMPAIHPAARVSGIKNPGLLAIDGLVSSGALLTRGHNQAKQKGAKPGILQDGRTVHAKRLIVKFRLLFS
jgi:hypothetical protein